MSSLSEQTKQDIVGANDKLRSVLDALGGSGMAGYDMHALWELDRLTRDVREASRMLGTPVPSDLDSVLGFGLQSPMQPNVELPSEFSGAAFGSYQEQRETASRSMQASERAAENVEALARQTADVAKAVGNLSSVIVDKVVPEWMLGVEQSQLVADKQIRKAKHSLWVAVAALIVSVALAGWQIWLTIEGGRDADAKHDASINLMKRQVEASEQLISAQAALEKKILAGTENTQLKSGAGYVSTAGAKPASAVSGAKQ
ncbi:hypothetical protein [Ideonella sp. A 288]|uniref:hypothetical protein n=1 Tax=Ideonella sp. A 288 TaxID=1962181 RepID=UPI001185B77E|nr:hypothetical protein [Ideonella sp. A 288]